MVIQRSAIGILVAGASLVAGCIGEGTMGEKSGSLADLGNADGVCEEGEEFCDGAAVDAPADDEADEVGEAEEEDVDTDEVGEAEEEAEDADDEGECDLPYDIKMALGGTYTPILDAFAEKGCAPDSIEVDLDGTSWRAEELIAGTAFVVTEEDCAHDGNRDTGRDRVNVTFSSGGRTETDHLDLRYCEGE